MSSIWGVAPKYLIDSVEILQRKALRIVFRKDPRCSRKELYTEKILPVALTCEYHTILLLFKMKHGLCKNNFPFLYMNQVHSHQTRNSANFAIPSHNTVQGSNNFFIRGPIEFNGLSNSLKSIISLSIFKNRLREYYYETIQ